MVMGDRQYWSATNFASMLHIYAQTCDWRRCADCVVGPGALKEATTAGAPRAT